jgi:hypothetical protein
MCRRDASINIDKERDLVVDASNLNLRLSRKSRFVILFCNPICVTKDAVSVKNSLGRTAHYCEHSELRYSNIGHILNVNVCKQTCENIWCLVTTTNLKLVPSSRRVSLKSPLPCPKPPSLAVFSLLCASTYIVASSFSWLPLYTSEVSLQMHYAFIVTDILLA